MPRSVVVVGLVAGLVLLAACSGDDASTSPQPTEGDAGIDTGALVGDADASVSSSDADASATADAGDAANATDTASSDDATSAHDAADASVTGDTSVTGDAGLSNDADAGSPDAGQSDGTIPSDGAFEGATDSDADGAADALPEAADEPVPDAPLDVDVSGGTVLLLGGGASTVFTGEFHPGAPWIASALTDATDDRPAVALTSASSGLGVIRSKGNSGEVRFTSWSPGAFGAFAAVANGVATSGAPAVAGSASHVDLAYQGIDLKYYFASFGGTWSPTAEPIGAGVDQSSGPTPPSITLLGADSVIAYADNARLLADRSRVSGIWQAVHTSDLGDGGAGVAVTPAIVAPASGPELLIAFVSSPDQDVFFATRTSGIWTAPQALAGAYAADPVALLALSGGDVILVYRSIDSHAYWARYSAGVWSSLKGFPWFDIAVPSTPSIASGVSGADAEIAFVNAADGSALHARLNGNTWSAPVGVGGSGLTSVSIASSP